MLVERVVQVAAEQLGNLGLGWAAALLDAQIELDGMEVPELGEFVLKRLEAVGLVPELLGELG